MGASIAGAWPAQGQTSATSGLTLAEAIQSSQKSYPSIQVSQEQMNAAAAAIRLARTAYLPRVDASAQFNRATRNNVFGLLLPQSTIPSISGPVIGSNNGGSVWGSAVGALVSWEPFDFGLRHASVKAASLAKQQSMATVKRTQFDVAVATADAYLTLTAAQETVRAAQAGVDRAQALARTIQAQVEAQLRPGADQSRAEAETAAARIQSVQAQQALAVARANLAQFTGQEPATIQLMPGGFSRLPASTAQPKPEAAAHPRAVEQRGAVEEAREQMRLLERSYFPRFFLQGAAYARGSGAEIDGRRLGGLNGLAPTVQDYAVGISVTFPILDFAAIHAREAAQSATIRSQEARYAEIALELKAQWNRAVATLDGARQIAATIPAELTSAQTATNQATARYQAGLANIDEVTEAQRLLTQAEIDEALARLGVWRGLLGVATAAGDIQPFVVEANQQ